MHEYMRNVVRPAALTLTLLASALLAGAPPSLAQSTSPAPAPTPLPSATSAPENSLVTARVRHEFEAWQHGRIDRTTYSPNAGGTYIDAFVRLVSPDLEAIGPVASVQYQTASLLLGDVAYRYNVTGTSGVVSVLYLLDGHGKTDLIVFTPEIFRNAVPSP